MRLIVLASWSVAVVALTLVTPESRAADPITRAVDGHIAKLTTQLGDEDFDTREAAKAGLRRLGVLALPHLARALKDPRPEAVHRADELIKELRPKAMPLVHELVTKPHITFRSLRFSRDGRRVAAIGAFALHVWETESGKTVTRVELKDYIHYAVEFAPDGASVWLGGDKIVRLDLATGKFTPFANEQPKSFGNLTLTDDGKYLLATARDWLYVYEAATGKKLHTVKVTPYLISQIRLSPDGKSLAAACPDRTVAIIDHVNGKLIREWQIPLPDPPRFKVGDEQQVVCVAWAPDGTSLACGMAGTEFSGSIHLRTPEGKAIRDWHAHPYLVRQLAFAAGGRLLLSVGPDFINDGDVVTAWNPEFGKPCGRVTGHDRLDLAEGSGLFAVFGPRGGVRIYHTPHPAWAIVPAVAK